MSSTPQSKIVAPSFHEFDESTFVTIRDRFPDAPGSITECVQRSEPKLVEILNLKIQVRIVLRHRRRYEQLRIEGCRRQFGEFRRCLATFRECRKESDIQRM